MRCPTLTELPLPSSGKSAWPWTEGSPQLPDTMSDGSPWPRVSIVTPSYNQGQFIEETIRSVLLQGYPNLEYIIIDGGSTDDSVEVIRKYEPWLTHWVSEPDGGMYDAISKGFAHSTGDVMAWINSDDMYLPWGLRVIGEIFAQYPKRVHWLTGLPGYWNVDSMFVHVSSRPNYARQLIRLGFYEGRRLGWIQQESTFWSRTLWEQAGSRLNTSLRLAGDFDLWCRFADYAELYTVQTVIAGFRRHSGQQTAHVMKDYFHEVDTVLKDRPAAMHLDALFRHRYVRLLTRFILLALSSKIGHIVRYDPHTGKWALWGVTRAPQS